MITGVAEGYYKGVIERNRALAKSCLFAAMPYGGEKTDHEKVQGMGLKAYLFKTKVDKIQLVYAGAMLPKAFAPLERMLVAIVGNPGLFKDLEIHFIGTGTSPNNPNGYNIKPMAQKYGLWEKIIFEYPARIPYLDVLVHLNASKGVFILGSTEAHYTPSKIYQAILSKKPVWAILHKRSTACMVLRDSGAGVVLDFNGEDDLEKITNGFSGSYNLFIIFLKNYDFTKINRSEFERYSAENVTGILVDSLDKVI